MKDAIQDKLSTVEELIKTSQREAAQKVLLTLRKQKIPERLILQFSNLCRRAEIPAVGLSVLAPAVVGKGRKKIQGSDEHRVEYAACLIILGACREAEKFLSSVDLESNPMGQFLSAGLCMKEWRYKEAEILFRKYMGKTTDQPYANTIGKINLALCLVFGEKYEEAASLINEVLLFANENTQWKIVKGNAYRILGSLEYYRGNYEFAVNAFHQAHKVFSDANTNDHFLIRKWLTLTNYKLSNGSASELAKVQKYREEAIARKHWEAVRDVDYQVAVHQKDEAALLKLYFGTPFEGFKNRILKHLTAGKIPTQYYWKLFKGERGIPRKFNASEIGLKPGLAMYRLYQALISDFYRPLTVVELFEKTFPGEHYIPDSSEKRVYQVVSRLRRELPKDLPLEIDSEEHPFCMVAKAPLEILCEDNRVNTDTQYDHRIEQLRQLFDGPFSIALAGQRLGIARRTANKLVASALANGDVIRLGAGNRTQYVFTSQPEMYKKAG